MEFSPMNDDLQKTETESDTTTESNNQPVPISELVARPDFPDCTLNQLVDIGGFTGVVVSIVRQSLKVKPGQGLTQSFNYNTLRKLYGPRVEVEPMPEIRAEPVQPEPEPPKRNVIAEPDFTLRIKSIAEFTGRADFPQCTFGQHVDIGGYAGVVVEIVNRSLKVRSQEETTRSYNAEILRKIYPPGKS